MAPMGGFSLRGDSMGLMVIDVPTMDELLTLVPVASYGDALDRRGGARHISALLPAACAALGAPVATRIHHDGEALRRALGIPYARAMVVVLVDGLGWWNIAMRVGHAPYLRSLLSDSANQHPISTCSPSTTVAAMATFGTGTCPGMTGMAGYTQRNVDTGKLCQLIQFTDAPEPRDLQREPTIFEQLRIQGVRATSVGLPKFKDSPLTRAALRGSLYCGSGRPGERIAKVARSANEPGLTYWYVRDTDKVGHAYGWSGEQWTAALEHVDEQLLAMRRGLPAGTVVVITADHGMIDAHPEQRIDIAQDEALREGVAMVAGEPRASMIYVCEGEDLERVAARWRERLQGLAVVWTRQEAMAAGVWGPVDERVMPMLGDLLVMAMGSVTIVDSRVHSEQGMTLPSVHGSMSRMEMDVPCLIDVVD